eukprot:3451741-Amphidinium_carterae.5
MSKLRRQGMAALRCRAETAVDGALQSQAARNVESMFGSTWLEAGERHSIIAKTEHGECD